MYITLLPFGQGGYFMPTPTYRLFEGPGHAWLEVPVSEVTANMNITRYSWTVGDRYYLEEDVDMWRFLHAKYGKNFTGTDLDRIVKRVYRNAPGY